MHVPVDGTDETIQYPHPNRGPRDLAMKCWALLPFENPYAGGGGRLCTLRLGHGGPHAHEEHSWTDEQAAAIRAEHAAFWAKQGGAA